METEEIGITRTAKEENTAKVTNWIKDRMIKFKAVHGITLSQTRIAEALGVSQPNVSRKIRMDADWTLSEFTVLCNIFNVEAGTALREIQLVPFHADAFIEKIKAEIKESEEAIEHRYVEIYKTIREHRVQKSLGKRRLSSLRKAVTYIHERDELVEEVSLSSLISRYIYWYTAEMQLEDIQKLLNFYIYK